jgi:hypothetical protein
VLLSVTSDASSANITDVYRVSLNVLVQRVLMKQKSDRSKVRDAVRQCRLLLELISYHMLLDGKREFGDEDVVRWGIPEPLRQDLRLLIHHR